MTTHAERICVAIPTFNRRAELVRALEALATQTDPDFDVIVCDDGSTEDIRSAVAGFEHRLRVQLVRIENSGGPARPRNVAVNTTDATWVSFLDSDDWWRPDRMAKIRHCLDRNVDVVFHRLKVHRDDNDRRAIPPHGGTLGWPIRGTDVLRHMLRFGNPVPTSAVTVRRSRLLEIGGFDESRQLASVEDYDAWLRLAAAGARFRFVDAVLGWYWVGLDNISAFSPRQFYRQRALFERQLGILPKNYRSLAASNFNYLLGSYAQRLDLPGAHQYLSQVSSRHELVRWLKARWKLLYWR